jgi:hypothetical protein
MWASSGVTVLTPKNKFSIDSRVSWGTQLRTQHASFSTQERSNSSKRPAERDGYGRGLYSMHSGCVQPLVGGYTHNM